jgi:L-fuculose-phosphate aldolase
MANHGVVTYGDDLDQAFMNMETVEHFAKIALVARTAGKPQAIPPEEVRKLEVIREQLQAARRADRHNVEEFRVASNQ